MDRKTKVIIIWTLQSMGLTIFINVLMHFLGANYCVTLFSWLPIEEFL